MKRFFVIALAGLALAGARPAWAHEEIIPATVPTGLPMFLTFSAANEKTVDLTSIRLVAPKELEFGASTREPTGWTAAKSSAAITWTGALKPGKFESFGFEIESANQPGDRTYTVTLTYANNTSENADVTLKVVPAVTGAAGGGGAADDAEEDDGGSSGTATVALALAVGALALAVGAMATARKKASPSGPPAGQKQDW